MYHLKFLACFCIYLVSSPAFASGASHADPVAPILLGLVLLFAGAKLGGIIADRLSQPAVLGELVMGVMLGNLGLVGYNGISFINHNEVFSIMAGIGVVLLLFEVGLESSVEELLGVGITSTIVAIIGVALPFALGYVTSSLFMPEKSTYIHTFVGATLCATSVGITARVFKDLGKIHIKEAKIILGAAVIDDVLGLIILAVVSGVIMSVAQTGNADVSLASIGMIAFKAIASLAVALVFGGKIAPHLFRFGAKLQTDGILLSLSLSTCFLMAYLANLVGLAPIVGAFAAGLVIDGTGFAKFFGQDEPSIEHLILPISKFFVPIFFVHMGMQVDLTTFMDPQVIALGLALTAVAILGKQACGLGVYGKGNKAINRIMIGIGMVPRGEVGLIFAVIGASLTINNEPVVDTALYSAIVLMVMLTTMITPPGIKWTMKREVHQSN
ncbi:MAG: cation:proton antiporter [Oligoflexales bacterium]|nr:cation:proton antiporter [Oligoflexales bacterium]